jgi:hypothetical protein
MFYNTLQYEYLRAAKSTRAIGLNVTETKFLKETWFLMRHLSKTVAGRITSW